MNDPANESAMPALAEQTLAEQTLAEQTLAEQTLAEQTLAEQTLAEQTWAAVLVNIFQPLPCDFCPSTGPTYRAPETGCFYCLPCLEMATDETLALEDGPEDAEIVAMGRAALDGLLPAPDRHSDGPTQQRPDTGEGPGVSPVPAHPEEEHGPCKTLRCGPYGQGRPVRRRRHAAHRVWGGERAGFGRG